MAELIYEKEFKEGYFRVYDERPSFELKHLKQVHSSIILKSDDSSATSEADGFFIPSKPHIAHCILTADCMPVLFLGKQGTVFLHAGWRGLANGILQNSLIEEANPYLVFIGPCIGRDSYEVGREFKDNFPNSKNFFEQEGKLFFDLFSQAKDEITELFGNIEVQRSERCTYTDSQLHSFRQNKTAMRNWNTWISKE